MKKDLPSSGKEIGQRALSRLSKDKDFAGKEIDRGRRPMKYEERRSNKKVIPSPVEVIVVGNCRVWKTTLQSCYCYLPCLGRSAERVDGRVQSR